MASAPAIFLELAEGVVTFELYWEHARRSCENMVSAVEDRLWEGVHLRQSGLLLAAQCDVSLGPIGCDAPSELSHSGAGLLTCPRADAGVWCITLAPAPALDSQCVIIGRVASGMGVLMRSLTSDPIIRSMRVENLPMQLRPSVRV